MTTQEAIASNKPFKRKWWHPDYWCVLVGWEVYLERDYLNAKKRYENGTALFKSEDIVWGLSKRYTSLDDVMAEDWETKQ